MYLLWGNEIWDLPPAPVPRSAAPLMVIAFGTDFMHAEIYINHVNIIYGSNIAGTVKPADSKTVKILWCTSDSYFFFIVIQKAKSDFLQNSIFRADGAFLCDAQYLPYAFYWHLPYNASSRFS